MFITCSLFVCSSTDSYLAGGLIGVRDMFFNSADNRRDVEDLLIILSNEDPSDNEVAQITTMADQLKTSGVFIVNFYGEEFDDFRVVDRAHLSSISSRYSSDLYSVHPMDDYAIDRPNPTMQVILERAGYRVSNVPNTGATYSKYRVLITGLMGVTDVTDVTMY